MDPLDDLKRLLPECLLFDQVRLGSRLAVLLRERGQAAPSALLQEITQLRQAAQRSAEACALRAANRPEVSYPPALPVSGRRDNIVQAIRTHQVVVVAGETGSGKTTQLPKMCLEAGLGVRGKIGCTQPRRVAATSISRRVAEELGVNHGREVGCKIRFSDETSSKTFIKFMTDGILLAEVQGDPNLTEYDAIVIDEAHERSLNIDFLLGHLRQLIKRRSDLKLIITSATIDTARFSAAFGDAPIIEVSGRVFPVEVRYAPLDELAEESGDQTYVDAAATAVEDVLTSTYTGDILVFLPGERDIRELRDLLESRGVGGVDLIPLFGRLSGADQQRAFGGSNLRKVVLATNIAETSITIPGIRYVVDAGLARISRYNPRTRTKRLPVEPVSRSSANQRKGRSGRVSDGVCIRLYSEEDFLARPEFTQPEIQRSNLAEVILRMKAARLGEIETFPFLEVPSPAAIRAGYDLLRELGAIDEQRQLTALGQDLAKLPVDPTIARIVLQSSREGVLEEVLVIASGLSIQDPRERPFDDANAASAAHRKFQHPGSDFLTLLNLWDTFHDQWEKLKTQGQLRKFCKANYLSYLRMREWVEIHAQLSSTFHDVLSHYAFESLDDEDDDAGKPASGNVERSSGAASKAPVASVPTSAMKPDDPRFKAIHRSILSGFLGHVAQRAERNLYKATGNRQVAVFPGSALHDKPTPQPPPARRGESKDRPPAPKSKQPEWIVAGEIVETSRLFARTLVGIQPEWIADLGAHLCKRTYDQPRWEPAFGQVMARERINFQGLEVATRRVAYGPIEPQAATEIFVRSALVEEGLLGEDETEPARAEGGAHPHSQHRTPHVPGRRRWQIHSVGFFEKNRLLREKIEMWRTRTRHHALGNVDDALFRFYLPQLTGVSSVHELNELLRRRLPLEPDFLCIPESELIGDLDLSFDASAFPTSVQVGAQPVAITYAYAPGEEHDGPTLQVPLGMLAALKDTTVVWSVPGLREEQISHLLRELPKALRRDLQPFAPKVKEIAAEFRPTGDRFLDELAAFISKKYRVIVPSGTWTPEQLPNHLRPRVEVLGPDRKTLAWSRDLLALEKRLTTVKAPALDELWKTATRQWEKDALTTWSLGAIPERLELSGPGGSAMLAFPGLKLEDEEVCLRLFRKPDEAKRSTAPAWARLVELSVTRELAWLQKDLKTLERHKILFATLGTGDELVQGALTHLKKHLFPPPSKLDEPSFRAAVTMAQERTKGLVPPFVDLVGMILQRRQELLVFKKPYASLRSDLDRLIGKRFLELTPHEQLPHLLRYLKAMLVRAERASVNPAKDQERARLVQPFSDALARWQTPGMQDRDEVQQFRWLLEEYKVSVFAQELGTAQPVSPKRLQSLMEQIQK